MMCMVITFDSFPIELSGVFFLKSLQEFLINLESFKDIIKRVSYKFLLGF